MSSHNQFVEEEEDDDGVNHHQQPHGHVGRRFRSPRRDFNPIQPLPPSGSGADVEQRSARTIANVNAARTRNRPESPPSPVATGARNRRRRHGAGEHRQPNPRGRPPPHNPSRHATWHIERETHQEEEDDEGRIEEQARRLGHQGRPYQQSVQGVVEGHAYSGASSNGASGGSWNQDGDSYYPGGLPATYPHASQQSSAPPPALPPGRPVRQRSMANNPASSSTSSWLSNVGYEALEDRHRRMGDSINEFETALGRSRSEFFYGDPWEGDRRPDGSHSGHGQR